MRFATVWFVTGTTGAAVVTVPAVTDSALS
jgi:hypothetical protein